MYGAAPFTREGSDECTLAQHFPDSFVYRVNLATLTIDQAIEVGAVPKFVAVTPNGKYLLVSNWCSYSESIIDTASGKVVTTIPLGPYPRGIAIDPVSGTAYVAVMGSTRIAAINLSTFEVSWISNVGSAPRHLVMSADGHWLYATINGSGLVDKIFADHPHGGRQGGNRQCAAQHDDLAGRQLHLRRELHVQHDEQGAHERHARRADRADESEPDRHHLRQRDAPGVGRVLQRLDHGLPRRNASGLGRVRSGQALKLAASSS